MNNEHNFKWDAVYDVIVLGFGGAGATSTRFAADSGAKVLLVDTVRQKVMRVVIHAMLAKWWGLVQIMKL